MSTAMKTVDDAQIEKAGPPLLSMKVSFGPAFNEGALTNGEFVRKLRTEAEKHPRSFISAMMSHFADHVDAAVASGSIEHDGEADTSPNTTYYGQGSCTGCPGDNGTGADCCLCVYNGVNVGCEYCN